MIAEIKKYTIVASDGVVNVQLGYYGDTTPQSLIETETITIPFTQFTTLTRTMVIERINDAIRRKIQQQEDLDDPPTEAEIEAVLPVGFRTVIPG